MPPYERYEDIPVHDPVGSNYYIQQAIATHRAPERQTVINDDDILNLQILLNTTNDVREFIALM